MIQIQLDNVRSRLIGNVESESVWEELREKLSYTVSGAQFTQKYQKGKWDGRIKLIWKNGLFLTGLLPYIEEIFKAHGVDYEIIDERKKPEKGEELPIKKEIEERKYQDKMVNACLKYDRGIIQACTGSGKTIVIVRVIAKYNMNTIVYVNTRDLLYQMKRNIEDLLKIECGQIGDSIVNIKKINVAMIQTVYSAITGQKYKAQDTDEELEDNTVITENVKKQIVEAVKDVELAIYDECQFLSSDSYQVTSEASVNAYHRWGFSASPWRDDNTDMLIEGATGIKRCIITASQLIKAGYLVRPYIYVLHQSPACVGGNYPSVYRLHVDDNQNRNERIILSAEKMVSKDRRVLILAKHKEHVKKICKALKEKNIKVEMVVGDLPVKKRERIKEKFEIGELQIMVATPLYDYGIDIPCMSGLILAGSGKSSTRALQRIGRTIRKFKNKADAVVVDFWDDVKYLRKHSKERLRIYKTEKEFEIKMEKTQAVKSDYEKLLETCEDKEAIEWKAGEFLAYFCKLYESKYGVRYVFPQNKVWSSKEIKDMKIVANFFNNAIETKQYLEWVFSYKEKDLNGIRGTGILHHNEMFNEFRKYQSLGQVVSKITGKTKIPVDFKDFISIRYKSVLESFEFETMRDLSFLAKHYKNLKSREQNHTELESAVIAVVEEAIRRKLVPENGQLVFEEMSK
jgi:superfamily II DNA or RNA helicase